MSKSTFRPVDVLIGEKDDIKDYIGKFSPLKDHSFAPGEYTMVFRDEAGNTVSNPIAVNIEVNADMTEIKVLDFKIDAEEPISDPSSVKVSFTVECESGVYFGSARFAVFPGNGGYEVYSKASEDIYLSPGERKELTIFADLSHLDNGHYMAMIYDGAKIMTDRVYFHIQRGTLGIQEMNSESNDTKIFDLNGIRKSNSPQSGIYIIEGKKVMIIQ